MARKRSIWWAQFVRRARDSIKVEGFIVEEGFEFFGCGDGPREKKVGAGRKPVGSMPEGSSGSEGGRSGAWVIHSTSSGGVVNVDVGKG